MNNFRYILIFCLFLYGCYGLDDEDLKDLSAISVDAVSDVINAKSGIPLNYTGIKISSDNDLPVTIDRAHGTSNPTATSYPITDKLITISDKLEIDYTFTKVGTYSLRLKVDNGESIVYKFFDLNVNSGLDEGILVLNNDEKCNGKLTLI